MENRLKLLLIGCGDIGARVIAQLNREVWQLTAMRRRLDQLPEGVAGIAGDVRDTRKLQGLLADKAFDAIVVSLTPDKGSDEGYRDSYVAGAASVVEAIAAAGYQPRLLLWVSSTGVYGQCDGEWVDEQSPVKPRSFRGQRLLEAERQIQGGNFPAVVVRFSGIYGPGRNRLLERVKGGAIAPARPAQWSNRIHSDDCAGVIVHLLEAGRAGVELEDIYLATDCAPAPLHEVQCWLAQQLGVPVVEQAGSSQLSANRRCSNRRLLASGYQFRFPGFQQGYGPLLKGGRS